MSIKEYKKKISTLICFIFFVECIYSRTLETSQKIGVNIPLTISSNEQYSHADSKDITPYGNFYDINRIGNYKKGGKNYFDENPLIYGGGYYDSESGLNFNKARYYSPKLSRFISQDSYDLHNRYQYANSDPINNFDPSGHYSFVNFLWDALTATEIGGVLGGLGLMIAGFITKDYVMAMSGGATFAFSFVGGAITIREGKGFLSRESEKDVIVETKDIDSKYDESGESNRYRIDCNINNNPWCIKIKEIQKQRIKEGIILDGISKHNVSIPSEVDSSYHSIHKDLENSLMAEGGKGQVDNLMNFSESDDRGNNESFLGSLNSKIFDVEPEDPEIKVKKQQCSKNII